MKFLEDHFSNILGSASTFATPKLIVEGFAVTIPNRDAFTVPNDLPPVGLPLHHDLAVIGDFLFFALKFLKSL
jgi:hypothetical protein